MHVAAINVLLSFPWITVTWLSNMSRSLYAARGLTYKVELLPDTLDFYDDQRHKQHSGYGLSFHLSQE